MKKKSQKNISREMCFILRHKPEKIIEKLNKRNNYKVIDTNGYVYIIDLLETLNISLEELIKIVNEDENNRYSFHESKLKIRANSSHSSNKINLDLEPCTPPDILYHGTATRFLNSIRKEGILKMNRHFLNLTEDIEEAIRVGSRHGKIFVLEINTKKMIDDKIVFYLSKSNVWMTDCVDPKYFLN